MTFFKNRSLWAVLCLVGVLLITKGSEGKLIVAGSIATPNQFRFTASLQMYSSDKQFRIHVCTLSVITTKTCLGAAHCVYNKPNASTPIQAMPASHMCIITGSVLQDQRLPCSELESYYPHDDYDRTTGGFDIALFILQSPVTIGQTVRTIKLAGPSYDVPLRTEVRVAGWGSVDVSEKPSRELRYTSMLVIDKSSCIFVQRQTTDYELCIYSGSSGAGKGDSGGAVFTPKDRVQIGVSVYAVKPGTTYPFVAIDVRRFHDWIISHSEGNPEFQS